MNTTKLDTQDAGQFKWWAARDARMKSIANASHYSDKQKVQAERMKLALEMVYSAKGIYVSFRKTGITVKVDACWVKDPKNLRALEAEWSAAGVKKRESAQGVNYNIPKA